MLLKINQIRTHPLMQGRINFNTNTVNDYIAHWEAGSVFPPVKIVKEGDIYWLADGYHRYESLKKATLPIPVDDRELNTEISDGTMADAIALACGANADHGLRRTNDDKVRQLIIYFSFSPEWAKKSNRDIATTCHVSHSFVNDWKEQLATYDRFKLFHRTKLDLQTIDKAKDNINLSLGSPIEATRSGKTLVIQRPPIDPPVVAQAAPTHIYIQTNTYIPRGTLLTKIHDSLTAPTFSSFTFNGEPHLIPHEEVALLPHQIGDRLIYLAEDKEVTITGFSIVGIEATIKIHAVDDNGFTLSGSTEFFSKKPIESTIQSVENPTIPLRKPKMTLVEPVVDFAIYTYIGRPYSYLKKGDSVRILAKYNQSSENVIVACIDNLRDKVEVNLKTLQIKQELPAIDLKILTVENLKFLQDRIDQEIRQRPAHPPNT